MSCCIPDPDPGSKRTGIECRETVSVGVHGGDSCCISCACCLSSRSTRNFLRGVSSTALESPPAEIAVSGEYMDDADVDRIDLCTAKCRFGEGQDSQH